MIPLFSIIIHPTKYPPFSVPNDLYRASIARDFVSFDFQAVSTSFLASLAERTPLPAPADPIKAGSIRLPH